MDELRFYPLIGAEEFISLKRRYRQFVDEFDPTPQYAFDDYNSCPDFDTWLCEVEGL